MVIQIKKLICADVGAIACPIECRTDNNGQPTGRTDGEWKNAVYHTRGHNAPLYSYTSHIFVFIFIILYSLSQTVKVSFSVSITPSTSL
ncbi:hypothetical protein ExPECSC028_00242 [Escherichia coli]|nr:hypothetical protein ExPECSC028_00242 [Escherichia coli]